MLLGVALNLSLNELILAARWCVRSSLLKCHLNCFFFLFVYTLPLCPDVCSYSLPGQVPKVLLVTLIVTLTISRVVLILSYNSTKFFIVMACVPESETYKEKPGTMPRGVRQITF